MTTPNHYHILRALSDGVFHSGESIARDLGQTRSAVWKGVHRLQEMGFDIATTHRKGYQLARPLELIDKTVLLTALSKQEVPIAGLHYFYEIDSTNNFLLQQTPECDGGVHLCVSEYQTGGRGRRGNLWHSPFACNLYFSLLLSFPAGVDALVGLSLSVGMSLARALTSLGLSGVKVKWPNDLVVSGKKLGGILTEVQGDMAGPCDAIIGIGLNYDMPAVQHDAIARPTTDIRQHCSQPVSRNDVLTACLLQLLQDLQRFCTSGFAGDYSAWEAWDSLCGQAVTAKQGQRNIEGIVMGINPQGQLLLEVAGEVTPFSGIELEAVKPL